MPHKQIRLSLLRVFMLFIGLGLFACNDSLVYPDEIIDFENIAFNKELTVDSVIIEVPIPNQGLYELYSLLNYEDDLWYLGYNEVAHSLDLFSLTNQKYKKSILLEKQGPNGIEKIRSVYFHSHDSIFLLTERRAGLLSMEGVLTKSWQLNVGRDSFLEKYLFTSHRGDAFRYDEKNESFTVGLVNIRNSASRDPKNFYKSSILGTYSLKENKREALKLNYPIEYSKNYFGFLDKPALDFGARFYFASFPAISHIYQYSRERDETVILNFKPKNANVLANSLSWGVTTDADRKLKHYIQNLEFGRVIPYKNNMLLRFYQAGLPQGIRDLSNPFQKKELHLMLIDLDNRQYQEVEFPERLINYRLAFEHDDEIWIPRFMADEGYLRFTKISIQ